MAFTYYVLLLLVLTSIAFADERREDTLSQSEDKLSQLDDNVRLIQQLIWRLGTDVGGLVENMQIVLTTLQDQRQETQEIKREQQQQREQLNGTIDRLKQLKQEQQHNSTQMKRVLDELKQSSEQLNGVMGNLNQEQQEMHELLHQHHQQILLTTGPGWCRGNKAGTIYVNNKYLSVPCDGKQGIVILNRVDGLHFTNRKWADFKTGFGDTSKSFWIGLDILHKLTSLNKCKLVVEIEDWDGVTRMAKYEHIHIEDENNGYRLNVAHYSGTAGDSLAAANIASHMHNGMKFTTTDRDNDKSGGNCATSYGGWWYNDCYYSNLAGKYFSYSDRYSYGGVAWGSWISYPYSFKRAKMTLVLR